MNDETKTLFVLTVAVSAAMVAGVAIGAQFARYKYQKPPPPNPAVRIIGTPNYTAVDTRDPLFITFYVNTNCNPNDTASK